MSAPFDIEKHLDDLTVELITFFRDNIPAITKVEIIQGEEGHRGTIKMSGMGSSMKFNDISICCIGHLMEEFEMRMMLKVLLQSLRR